MSLDLDAVRRGCRGASVEAGRELCRRELERARGILAESPATVACTQEAPLFSEIAAHPVTFTNIRENAGWSNEGRHAGPKMAALLAAAAEPMPETAFRSEEHTSELQAHSDVVYRL